MSNVHAFEFHLEILWKPGQCKHPSHSCPGRQGFRIRGDLLRLSPGTRPLLYFGSLVVSFPCTGNRYFHICRTYSTGCLAQSLGWRIGQVRGGSRGLPSRILKYLVYVWFFPCSCSEYFPELYSLPIYRLDKVLSHLAAIFMSHVSVQHPFIKTYLIGRNGRPYNYYKACIGEGG